MNAHDITNSDAPNNRSTVETLHHVGVWAVHFNREARVYVVTHTPTGGKVEPCDTLPEAKDIADALGASFPDFAADSPWGKSLTVEPEVMEAIRAIVTNVAADYEPESP